jgi:hypothetical protein
MGISLGVAEKVLDEDISRAVWALLADPARRREMRSAGIATIDADGALRVAADLAAALNARRVSAPLAANG